jgi:hypothetical protein
VCIHLFTNTSHGVWVRVHAARITDEQRPYLLSGTAFPGRLFGKTIADSLMFIISLRRYSVRPPLWSSGHSSWLQNPSSGFDSRRYQIF